MKTKKIPYHKTETELHIDEKYIRGILTSRTEEYVPDGVPEDIIRRALAEPIGSESLQSLSKKARRIVIVTSDHTRAVPSKKTLPIMLEEIRRVNPYADITILIATGLHRKTTVEEQRSMFGDMIVDNERIVVNDS